MNNILTLRGNKFIQEKRNGGGGPIKLSNNLRRRGVTIRSLMVF